MSSHLEVLPFGLSGVHVVRPRVFRDERGFFLQTFEEGPYRAVGIDTPFVQDNHSSSGKGTVRGMHFQTAPGQAKLVRAARGRIWDVVVDMRVNSPTFGKWEGVVLDDQEHVQIFVPVGFAHGFCVLSETADVCYKVSAPYDPSTEAGFRWNDPDIGIEWPTDAPLLSPRDVNAPPFSAIAGRVSS